MQDDEGRATVELASIMIATSTTVSAGPSSPPLEQHKPSGIIPPARPSSTPFPHTEPRSSHIVCLGCPDDTAMTDLASATNLAVTSTDSCGPLITLNLNDLPAEIHECILDHLFGYRVSTTSKSSVGMSSWGTALRHSRRKELSRLALVSRVWRDLIQERLYRHIKLKATVESINCAIEYFAEHPRLRPYVKHMEIWFPVFQPKYGPPSANSAQILPTLTIDGLSNTSYTLPADNCTLDEAFYFVGATFPEVCVMTLEGGERKKAPQVKHFISEASPRGLPKIRAIRTLILKGQWNLARVDTDFNNILAALPSLQEWHGSYSKPKSKSYISMATVLPTLSQGLKHLNLCLEGDYRREMSSPPYFMKVAEKLHFCSKLAEAVRNLEYLSYTGRVCRTFFDMAAKLVDPRSCKVKSIDLTVKNCCRPLMQWGDSGSGITDANFINAFESLVLAGIRSLDRLKSVKYLRIRYVDLGKLRGLPPQCRTQC